MKDSSKGAVIVTGAGSGIGYAVARKLLSDGYGVSALDISAGCLTGVNDRHLAFHEIDVRDGTAIDRAVTDAAERFGSIKGLVTCAAVFKAAPFLELDEETWDTTFAVNLKGSLLACQAVLPVLRRQGGGAIVLFASTLARTGAIEGAHYAASKGGVLGFARSLAIEVAAENIRVNVVSPGITDTPQPRGNMSEAEMLSKADRIPLGRIGEAADMAEAVAFLMSDDASFVTGQDIRVNGGAGLF
jgi:NAD(P)-dependent dehydrogenase (short-subunit alcohol dehydrogenase family)